MHTNTFVVLIGEKNARYLTLLLIALMYVSAIALVVTGVFLPTVLLVSLALPTARWVWLVFTVPKPKEPPIAYPQWPLWYVAIAFLHNRRFGILYLIGIFSSVLLRALVFHG